MEDAIKSIKAYLYDRESSPLTGAYLVIWCIWNFRLILIIFSGDPISIKFANIENYLFEPSYFIPKSLWLGPLWVYLAPLILALIYLLVLPILSIKVYEQTLEFRLKLNEVKQKIENQELLSKEESIRIRKEIFRLSEEYEQQIEKKDVQINMLKAQLQEISAPKDADSENKAKKEIASIFENLSYEEKVILHLARADNHGTLHAMETLDGTSLATSERQLVIEGTREWQKYKAALKSLEKINLLEKKVNSDIYELTSLGFTVADLIIEIGLGN